MRDALFYRMTFASAKVLELFNTYKTIQYIINVPLTLILSYDLWFATSLFREISVHRIM